MGPAWNAETPVGGDPTGTGMEVGREGRRGREGGKTEESVQFFICLLFIMSFMGTGYLDTNIRLH